MPHFLINSSSVENNSIILKDREILQHLIKSLRLQTGEKVLFLDENEIQYETLATEIQKTSVLFTIQKKYKSQRKLNFHLSLAQSVLKTDAQISLIQKATELGVKEIIPIYTDNCTVKQNIINNKINKWQKIALESVKQCERADIPKILELSTLPEVIKGYDEIFVFVEKYSKCDFKEYISKHKIKKESNILVIIGCEGGFSEKEFLFMKDKNLPMITLSDLIMRADTACTAALITVINELNHVQY